MTRLHLINWHNFQDDLIDFKDITYLLGVNAVGKTTIMDAIRYCLTTNKDFNTAGNKKSGRTLLGSVHQKQRAEDSYLRPGHTVSYIGIEFLDESIKKTFVIIARVESETPKQDLGRASQDWYITKPGYSLEDIPFFTEIENRKQPTSREDFYLENKGMERASNLRDAKSRICRVLGIGDATSPIGKKFNEVFHMGTSLEDIKDIREFIYTYILPEPEVNIDFLQKDMRELERLQEVLQEAQDRESLLSEINEKIKEAKRFLSNINLYELLKVYAKYQGTQEEQTEKQHAMTEWSASVEVLASRLEELSGKATIASELLYEAKKAAEDNTENKKMLSLEKENQSNNEEFKNLRKEGNDYANLTMKLTGLKNKLNRVGFSCEWDDGLLLRDSLADMKVAEIQKASKLLIGLKDSIKEKEADYFSEIKIMKNNRQELEKKIKTLESGVMCYPKAAILVRDEINARLEALSRKKEAKLLCELLYMTDDSWQDAVESYLNTQRFNIIVTPENYLIAKEVFISLGDKVKGIGLIDTRKIKDTEYTNQELSYLGNKVESENIYAKRYARFIMKDVVCCDDSKNLEQYKKSVTRDRLRFQNFCLQRMQKNEHFIGVDAIAKQLEHAKNELVLVQYNLSELEAKKNEFAIISSEYMTFIVGDAFVRLERYCDSNQKAKALAIRMEEIKKQIDEFKKNPILLEMYDRVEECQKTVTIIQGQITDFKAEKQNFEKNIEDTKKKLAYLEENGKKLQVEYEEKLKDNPEQASKVKEKYEEARKEKNVAELVEDYGNQALGSRTKLQTFLVQQLIPLQQTYTAKYTCDFPEGIEGASQYQQEFLSLKNIELERHKQELVQAQVRCKDRFRKEVLFRMKDDILRARQQFKQINRVMENLEYGEESYHFGIDKSKDKELGIFYDIIMDKDNQQIDEENEILTYIAEKNKSDVFEGQIEDFMSRIMLDVEEHAKENLTGKKSATRSSGMYVDYRTYLDYDIIVKNSVTGMEAPLSKVSGEGSGGENQAPFYVAICASLLQIYEQNPDGCIRLLLLDEAFNNMTSDRIEPMMNMFKKLNLQLVLIATAEKATAIIPYCDITYSIVKSGNRNAIGVFERI